MPASGMTQDVAPGTFDALASAEAQPAAHVKTRHLARYQAILPGLGMHLIALIPLYAWLNTTDDPQQEARAGDCFDLEDARPRIAHDNLSLGVWRRGPTV